MASSVSVGKAVKVALSLKDKYHNEKCDESETLAQSNCTGNADTGMIKMKAIHKVVGIMQSAIEQKVKNSH